jgi:hypothetical protein
MWKKLAAFLTLTLFVAMTTFPVANAVGSVTERAGIPVAAVPLDIGSTSRDLGNRALNSTEHMGLTDLPPTIDGEMMAGEWDDAAIYDIGTFEKDVKFYIMFDGDHIYIAIDAKSDITNDQGDPPSYLMVDNSHDYFLISIDGEDDGQITYVDPNTSDTVPGEWPPTMNPPGMCVDRGAATSGGDHRVAGWWNMGASIPNLWVNTFAEPNQGAQEPYDYINPGFDGHRTYEYSIPYNGTGDELLKQPKETIGMTVKVFDYKGGSGSQNVGQFPSGGSYSGPPYQRFMLNGLPRAMVNLTGGPYYKNEMVPFDASGSLDPDGSVLDYYWDFDYDGMDFVAEASSTEPTITNQYANKGKYTVAVKVVDYEGAADFATTEVEILNLPMPPSIYNTLPADTVSLMEGEGITFSADFDDVNFNDGYELLNIAWVVDGVVNKSYNASGPGSTDLSIWTYHTGDLSAGGHLIDLYVNDTYDPKGLLGTPAFTATHQWKLIVSDVNQAPVIVSADPKPFTSVFRTEEEDLNVTIEKMDPDGDEMNVAWFINGELQNETGDTLQFLKAPDYDSDGTYILRVEVTDVLPDPLMDFASWNVTITNINRPPQLVTTSPDVSELVVKEGKSVHLEVMAEDPDGDELSYEWLYNGRSIIKPSALSEYWSFMDFNSGGRTFTITVNVTDGLKNTSFEWTITVEDVDRPPEVKIASPMADDHHMLSDEIKFDCSKIFDPDGDELTYLWDLGDGTLSSKNLTTHRYEEPGHYQVSLKVTGLHDGVANTVESFVNITVDAAVLKITSIVAAPDSVKKGKNVTLTVNIRNEGTIAARNIILEIYTAQGLVKTRELGSLNPGDDREAQISWKFNEAGVQTFMVQVTADPNTVVPPKTSSNQVNVEKKSEPTTPGTTVDNTTAIALPIIALVVMLGMAFVLMRGISEEKRWLDERERVGRRPPQRPRGRPGVQDDRGREREPPQPPGVIERW